MKKLIPEFVRVQQQLEKLEQRALTCRGLFPVHTQLEFLNLASDHQFQCLLSREEIATLTASELHDLLNSLEYFWHPPSFCQQALAQSLLRYQSVTLKTYQPGDSLANNWQHIVRAGLELKSETTGKNKQCKSV